MPKPPKMAARSIKVGDALWDAAMQKATERQESLSAVIRDALTRYVHGQDEQQENRK